MVVQFITNINSITLCDEQAMSIKEGKRRRKNIFAQVKHFTMLNEKQITSFSKTRFISKYLPIDESDISPPKQIKYSAITFQQVMLFSLLFQFYRRRIFLQIQNVICHQNKLDVNSTL